MSAVRDTALRSLTGYQLQRATSAAMIRYKAVFKSFGLRRTTFSALSLIIENPGLRQSQLAETLAIERPNLVSIVEDLTRAGLIERKTSETDRRAYALSATRKGRAAFDKAYAAVLKLDDTISRDLSDAAGFRGDLAQVERNALGDG